MYIKKDNLYDVFICIILIEKSSLCRTIIQNLYLRLFLGLEWYLFVLSKHTTDLKKGSIFPKYKSTSTFNDAYVIKHKTSCARYPLAVAKDSGVIPFRYERLIRDFRNTVARDCKGRTRDNAIYIYFFFENHRSSIRYGKEISLDGGGIDSLLHKISYMLFLSVINVLFFRIQGRAYASGKSHDQFSTRIDIIVDALYILSRNTSIIIISSHTTGQYQVWYYCYGFVYIFGPWSLSQVY